MRPDNKVPGVNYSLLTMLPGFKTFLGLVVCSIPVRCGLMSEASENWHSFITLFIFGERKKSEKEPSLANKVQGSTLRFVANCSAKVQGAFYEQHCATLSACLSDSVDSPFALV